MNFALSIVLSVVSGIASHLIFFPVIEAWHNRRLRRLARPSIGVITNIAPFIIVVKSMKIRDIFDCNYDQTKAEERALFLVVSAYMLSFVFNGIGVMLGYIIDDVRGK